MQLSPQVEFVPLGMPAEIVVVVQNQNSGLLPPAFAVEVRSGQAANASSYHNKIELLFGINWVARICSVANGVCSRIRPFMATPKARQSRRIVPSEVLPFRKLQTASSGRPPKRAREGASGRK